MTSVEHTATSATDSAGGRGWLSSWKFWLMAVMLHLLFFLVCARVYVLVIEPQKYALQGRNLEEGIVVSVPEAQPFIASPLSARREVPLQLPVDLRLTAPSLLAIQPTLPIPIGQRASPVTPLSLQPDQPLALNVPSLWVKRVTANKRQLVPDPAIEDAVAKSLRWLKKNQNDDGSWGKAFPIGMTGLALLTFSAHGETAASKEFGDCVQRGINYLLSFSEQGRMGKRVDYEHGIATYALAEHYGLTKEPRLREPLEKYLQTIIQGQGKSGGWIYGFKPVSSFGDLSVSGWQIQALKSAHMAGVLPDAVAPALDKAMKFVKSMFFASKKGFGYQRPDKPAHTLPGGPQPVWSLTGDGVLCLQFWKNADAREVKDAVAHMNENLLFQNPFESEGRNLYGYYYATQALFLFDGPHGKFWLAWDRQFRKPLLAAQKADGSFPGCGSGLKDDADKLAYSTSLSTLMLEVWYRHDPAGVATMQAK